MLQFFRGAAKTWVMRVFFAVLVVSFVVLWGTEGFQRSGQSNRVLVTVGKNKLTITEFAEDMRHAKLRAREQDENTLKQNVLVNWIRKTLLDLECDNLDLVASESQIRDNIKSNSAFSDKQGRFRKEIFAGFLHNIGMTEKQYLEELRKQMRRAQLLQLYAAGVIPPVAFIDMAAVSQLQKRIIEVVDIKAEGIKNLPVPSDDDLQKYHEKHSSDFTIAEGRDLTVMILDEATIARNLNLTSEEIAISFNARSSEITGLPTKADHDRIMQEIKTEKAQEKIYELTTEIDDAFAGGATLEEVAKLHSLGLVHIKQAKLKDLSDKKASEGFSPEVHAAILNEGFAGSAKGDVNLTEVKPGMYIAVRIDAITPSRVLPLAESRNEVFAGWSAEFKLNAAQIKAKEIQSKVEKGDSLSKIASEAGLRVKTMTVSRSDAKDKKITPAVLISAFSTLKGKSNFASDEEGAVVVYVQDVINSKIDHKSEDVKQISERASSMLINDIVENLMLSLSNKYKIEENKKILEAL